MIYTHVLNRGGRGVKALPEELSHPHVLRHTRGYLMVEKGYPLRVIQEWLGHKQIQHTVRYTALSAAQFRDVVD